MKKTIEQLIAEGKRKRAARLLRSGVTPIWPGIEVLNGWAKHPDLLTTVGIPTLTQNITLGMLSKVFEEPPISSIAQRHKEITGNAPTVIRITNNDLRAAARWMRDEEHLDDDDTDAD